MKKILILGASLAGLSLGAMGDMGAVLANTPDIPERSDISERQETPQEGDSSSTISTPPIGITVLDPGAEPRQLLRFSPKVGDKQRSRAKMTSQSTMAIDGQPIGGFNVPPIEIVSETETLKVEPDGTIHMKLSVETKVHDSPESESFITPLLKSQFESASKASVIAIYDAQGRVIEAGPKLIDENSKSPERLRKPFEISTHIPTRGLPTQPVGVGATWSYPQIITVNGLKISQTFIHKIEEIQGDHVTLSVRLAPGAEFDVSKLFSFPPNVKAEVQSLDVSGGGTMSFDLSQFLAIATNFDYEVKMEIAVTDSNTVTTITMGINSNMQILE